MLVERIVGEGEKEGERKRGGKGERGGEKGGRGRGGRKGRLSQALVASIFHFSWAKPPF